MASFKIAAVMLLGMLMLASVSYAQFEPEMMRGMSASEMAMHQRRLHTFFRNRGWGWGGLGWNNWGFNPGWGVNPVWGFNPGFWGGWGAPSASASAFATPFGAGASAAAQGGK